MKGLYSKVLPVLALLTAFIVLPAIVGAANSALSPEPLTVSKAASVVSAQTKAALTSRNQSQATVWVFFTDKGVRDRNSFARAASQVTLSAKVIARRAKVGKSQVLFVDLPVVADYVNQIQNLGGTLRRQSRYLNAASFELPMNLLDQVAGLPFVAEILPVAEYVRSLDPIEIDRPSPESDALASPWALGYGSSYTQLNLMKVPNVHLKGYNGQGVTLAVFDTGFRKSHQAFTNAYAEHRVIAEYDFIFNDGNTANEAADASNQWSHGTSTWSLAGGLYDGKIYGPAYKADFILAKTEDVRSEKHVEEDNWVRALEWADSLGADVITSSLGYRTFDTGQYSYTYADMNGLTAITTRAANTADSLGIVVCNAMANDGPGVGTLAAPADAFGIVAVGAVTSAGSIASFSSRGPTYDGRIKPEVCAMGVSTYAASSSGDAVYNAAFSGTSAATPLAAGAACLVVEARPTFPPSLIRQALMATASNAATPNNDYGSGIINVEAAIAWGCDFSANVTKGTAPLTVQFTDLSQIPATSRLWDFGDGNTSTLQNPSHYYASSGHYTVTLTNQTAYGPLSVQRTDFIVALGDTLRFSSDSAFAGHQGVMSVMLTNSQPLQKILVPFTIAQAPLRINVDSITMGTRTSYFDLLNTLTYDVSNNLYAMELVATNGSTTLPLDPGSGEILKVYWTSHPYDLGTLANVVDTGTVNSWSLKLTSPATTYLPAVISGTMGTKAVKRGDFTHNFFVDLSDLSAIVAFLTGTGAPPLTIQCGDFNADFIIDLSDLSALISYLTGYGPPPVNP